MIAAYDIAEAKRPAVELGIKCLPLRFLSCVNYALERHQQGAWRAWLQK